MTDQEIDQVIKQAIDPSASHHARVALIPMLVAVIRAQQWKPIETAPRDGGYFMALSPDMSKYPVTVKWSLHEDRWCEEVTTDWCDPTHWMPLPKPPTE